jgi:hypothetical protein
MPRGWVQAVRNFENQMCRPLGRHDEFEHSRCHGWREECLDRHRSEDIEEDRLIVIAGSDRRGRVSVACRGVFRPVRMNQTASVMRGSVVVGMGMDERRREAGGLQGQPERERNGPHDALIVGEAQQGVKAMGPSPVTRHRRDSAIGQPSEPELCAHAWSD